MRTVSRVPGVSWNRTFATVALALGISFGWASSALAGGYDVPRLYGARYVGMGATGVGAADDSISIYFNPAGLAEIDVASLDLDGSFLTGFIEASPTPTLEPVRSDRTNAPFLFAGGAARIAPWLVAGFGAYPVAASGAVYRYDPGTGTTVRDESSLYFIEFAPAVALHLPEQRLSFGASYRMTMVRVPIEQGPVDGPPTTQFTLKGRDFAAVRLGAQWRPIDGLSLGLAFRSKVSLEASTDEGLAYNLTFSPIESDVTLPPRVSAGFRYDVSIYGFALDFHYVRNSINSVSQITLGAITTDVINDWQDSVELHAGSEAVLLDGRLPVRIGYIFDSQVTSRSYPSAFGSPPGGGHTGTLGVGWNQPRWHVDLAYSVGGATATVTDQDLMGGDLGTCTLCGGPGTYRAVIHALNLGAGYSFE